ncbi:MAG: CoA transferase [Dehalococcoidia bacterium]
MTALPLAGVRVLDLTSMLAGVYATRLLADMGAETVKVESLRRYDPTRGAAIGDTRARVYPGGEPGDRPWNRSSYFNEENRNKLGLTLDLQRPEGRDLFARLVAVSDVVIENFSAGVMEKLGFGYGVLRDLQPAIVYVSMPAFGNDGPWRDAVAYGNTVEMLAGMAAVNGYVDGLPTTSGITYGDPIAGVHAAFAALTALEHRDRTGEGQYVDLSQLETMIGFLGELALDYSMNGRVRERSGNHDNLAAPHAVYRCTGADAWVAVSVATDAQWQALCAVLGRADLVHDPRFALPLDRLDHQDELDAIVEGWTVSLTPVEAMTRLQAAGVAAGAVYDAGEFAADPHVAARGYLETVAHPDTGPHTHPGLPWRMTGVERAIRAPAPGLGVANVRVLGDLIGVGGDRLAALEEQAIIGTIPDAVRDHAT